MVWIVMVIVLPANLDRHPSADFTFATPIPITDVYGLANKHAWRISSDDLELHFSDGAPTTVGSEAGSDLEAIQAGIDVANGGNTVLVAPGESVITVPITF